MKIFSGVFKKVNFWSLLISQVLSQFTINVLSFLIILKLFEQTGSSIATSLLWISYAIPSVVIGPIAAALVDFVDKRLVLMITNLLQAAVVLVYAILLYKNFVFLPYAVVLIFSFLNQFYVPAEAAALPTLIGKEDLPVANSIFFVTQQSSLIVGFGLAGIFYQIMGLRASVISVSILLFVAFLSVSFLPRIKPKRKLAKEFEERVSQFFDEIVEGYRFIRDNHEILFPFLLLLGLQVIIAVIVTNLPSIATDVLRISPTLSGFLIITPAGIGALLGTYVISKILTKKTDENRLILIGISLFTVDIFLATLFLPLITIYWVRVFVGVITFMFIGFSAVSVLVPSVTFLQRKTPQEMLGRVFGNFWFLTTVVTILPVLFSATVTDLLGIRWLLFLMSLMSIIILVFLKRKMDRQI